MENKTSIYTIIFWSFSGFIHSSLFILLLPFASSCVSQSQRIKVISPEFPWKDRGETLERTPKQIFKTRKSRI